MHFDVFFLLSIVHVVCFFLTLFLHCVVYICESPPASYCGQQYIFLGAHEIVLYVSLFFIFVVEKKKSFGFVRWRLFNSHTHLYAYVRCACLRTTLILDIIFKYMKKKRKRIPNLHNKYFIVPASCFIIYHRHSQGACHATRWWWWWW